MRLEDIVERAGLATGAVYSLFGSKNGRLVETVADALAPRDESPGRRLATSVADQEERLVLLLSGREFSGKGVTDEEAHRLVPALRAVLLGPSQGVVFGITPQVTEEYMASAARALVTRDILGR